MGHEAQAGSAAGGAEVVALQLVAPAQALQAS